jgi:hypothetical protein
MEWWNTGILEENNLGRDERLAAVAFGVGGSARPRHANLCDGHGHGYPLARLRPGHPKGAGRDHGSAVRLLVG